MGCGSSTTTAVVQPLTQGEVNGDEEETGSKLGSRGDSAVSKGTTDSGVVMENKEIPGLPGAVPRKLPPLTSACVKEIEADRITKDAASPGLLQQDSTAQERQKSCEILKELLNQGIIPLGQTRQGSSICGEAYSIMLHDRDVRRRPPARLESLKAKNVQSLPSKEEIDKKIRLVEERRKLREDELRMRLRTKSARVRVRVRAAISSREEDEDMSLNPVNPLQSPLTCEPTPALLFHGLTGASGGECVREAGGDGTESEKEIGKAQTSKGSEKGRASGDSRGQSAEWVNEDGDEAKKEEELNEVEELQAGQLLTASGELESDFSFQHAKDKEETF
ncbi:stathmin domain-containing protein 1 isoform X1 [Seriola aureovittata]|uniref:stathmin domain-containing protein 1 isoform X1 n=2 Tax=Seriola aureovittata TaxID=2871759 RepID=UPI0024BE3556|nr:stathmin domain-containing protein 1 isoform X1 [Seriola aureovittata]